MDFICKNGFALKCRPLKETDVQANKDFLKVFSTQTIFTNQYPNQPEKEDAHYLKQYKNPDWFVYGAFDENGALAGIARSYILRPDHPWLCYTAGFTLTILNAWQGQGLGTHFLSEIEKWALLKNMHRLNGEVRCENIKAIGLYLKAGFIIEGCSKDTAFINGKWHNSYHIGKILGAKTK